MKFFKQTWSRDVIRITAFILLVPVCSRLAAVKLRTLSVRVTMNPRKPRKRSRSLNYHLLRSLKATGYPANYRVTWSGSRTTQTRSSRRLTRFEVGRSARR